MPHTISAAVAITRQMSSVYTRSGQTRTLSSLSSSTSGSPALSRESFIAARRNASHRHSMTLITMIVIGTLSGFATIERKSGSAIDPK
jgi:hypothetical protein